MISHFKFWYFPRLALKKVRSEEGNKEKKTRVLSLELSLSNYNKKMLTLRPELGKSYLPDLKP